MTSLRGFCGWSPSPASRAMVGAVAAALDDDQDLGALGTVSVRGVYYWCVTRGFVPKTEGGYRTVKKALTRARRAGLIPFEKIVDNGVTDLSPTIWTGPHQVIATARSILMGSSYALDRQRDQTARIYLWTEAVGTASGQAQIAHKYAVPVISSGGQPSLSFNHALAQRLIRDCEQGGNDRATILQVGDWDAKGLSLVQTVSEDVQAFAGDLGPLDVEVVRVALTEAQITSLGLPTGVQKQTDTTADKFPGIGGDGSTTCEVDALPPPVLRQIVEDAIKARIDLDLFNAVLDQEVEDRAELRAAATRLDD